MERFDRARVSLKHHGTFPSHIDIEDFRSMVGGFFKESSPKAFAIDFDDISLAGLVRPENVRESLELAEQAIRNEMRLENVFFRVRPIVLSLVRSTMKQSHSTQTKRKAIAIMRRSCSDLPAHKEFLHRKKLFRCPQIWQAASPLKIANIVSLNAPPTCS
jgi:hypothetical protein